MKEDRVKNFQRGVKYCAMALAIFLTVSIIGGILGTFSSLFGIFGGKPLDNLKDYELSGEIHSIDLEIAATELKIASGESFSVKSNIPDLKVDISDGTLKIEEPSRLFGNYNNAVLEVVIPQTISFKNASLTLGAGAVNISSIVTENLDLELGAGKVVIGSLTATRSADIDGGAGELNINGGSLCDLDFDMGVGECNFRSRLSGDCDLDMGVGEANLKLLGAESDYRIEFSTGIGSATLNGERVENGQVIGNGTCRIEISGGIGAVNVIISAE